VGRPADGPCARADACLLVPPACRACACLQQRRSRPVPAAQPLPPPPPADNPSPFAAVDPDAPKFVVALYDDGAARQRGDGKGRERGAGSGAEPDAAGPRRPHRIPPPIAPHNSLQGARAACRARGHCSRRRRRRRGRHHRRAHGGRRARWRRAAAARNHDCRRRAAVQLHPTGADAAFGGGGGRSRGGGGDATCQGGGGPHAGGARGKANAPAAGLQGCRRLGHSTLPLTRRSPVACPQDAAAAAPPVSSRSPFELLDPLSEQGQGSPPEGGRGAGARPTPLARHPQSGCSALPLTRPAPAPPLTPTPTPAAAICLYHKDATWTYEICHRNRVKQFRQASAPQTPARAPCPGRLRAPQRARPPMRPAAFAPLPRPAPRPAGSRPNCAPPLFLSLTATRRAARPRSLAAAHTTATTSRTRQCWWVPGSSPAAGSEPAGFFTSRAPPTRRPLHSSPAPTHPFPDAIPKPLQEDTSASGRPVKYVVHKFSGGATCHLTGAPRTAEVRPRCPFLTAAGR
jgi:hypothetical protein